MIIPNLFICLWFQDEVTNGEKLGFEVKYEGEDLVLEERTFFGIENLSMVTYNIMSDSTSHGFYSIAKI